MYREFYLNENSLTFRIIFNDVLLFQNRLDDDWLTMINFIFNKIM